MGISGSTARRAASALAVATVAAGLVGGLGGARVRADVRGLLSPAAAAPAWMAAGDAVRRDQPPAPLAVRSAGQVQAVTAAVAPLVADRPPGSVSVAALDATTGARFGWGAAVGVTAASVFKLELLEGYLLQNQDRGQAPGAGAADALTAMIENSDNDAADHVYAVLGGHAGVAAAVHRLGLSATALGAADRWGLSTTDAADQLTALAALVSPQGPLSAASRAYALGLMSNVESDQRWGVGAAADPGTGVASKDGWLPVDDDGGRWVASSVGVIQLGGHPILLAVLTQHDADLADGIGLVESLSRTVATTLRGTVPPTPPPAAAGR